MADWRVPLQPNCAMASRLGRFSLHMYEPFIRRAEAVLVAIKTAVPQGIDAWWIGCLPRAELTGLR